MGARMIGKPGSTKEIELHPDAWKRFERATDVVTKAPPQHRVKEKSKLKKAAKKTKRQPNEKT
jgi:hypothetical protein